MKVKPYIVNEKLVGYVFYCEGCKEYHRVLTDPTYYPASTWTYNGNPQAPTFTPSVLVRSGHYIPEHKSESCWCTFNKEAKERGEKPAPFECTICHTFITDGKIQYLSDCTHELAGQTIELPNID